MPPTGPVICKVCGEECASQAIYLRHRSGRHSEPIPVRLPDDSVETVQQADGGGYICWCKAPIQRRDTCIAHVVKQHLEGNTSIPIFKGSCKASVYASLIQSLLIISQPLVALQPARPEPRRLRQMRAPNPSGRLTQPSIGPVSCVCFIIRFDFFLLTYPANQTHPPLQAIHSRLHRSHLVPGTTCLLPFPFLHSPARPQLSHPLRREPLHLPPRLPRALSKS